MAMLMLVFSKDIFIVAAVELGFFFAKLNSKSDGEYFCGMGLIIDNSHIQQPSISHFHGSL